MSGQRGQGRIPRPETTVQYEEMDLKLPDARPGASSDYGMYGSQQTGTHISEQVPDKPPTQASAGSPAHEADSRAISTQNLHAGDGDGGRIPRLPVSTAYQSQEDNADDAVPQPQAVPPTQAAHQSQAAPPGQVVPQGQAVQQSQGDTPYGRGQEADGHREVLLHGTLHVTVRAARNLPHKKLLRGLRAHALPALLDSCLAGTSRTVCGPRHAHAYVVVAIGMVRRARTQVVMHTHDPEWDDAFTILVADKTSEVRFKVKDDEFFGAATLGEVIIPAVKLLQGQKFDAWFPLVGGTLNARHKPSGHKRTPELDLSVSFEPVAKTPYYGRGLHVTGGGHSKNGGIVGTYFPARQGCQVRLYNDAHQEAGTSPQASIQLDSGKPYHTQSYFSDLFHDIGNARILIYITGWSVYDKIHLIRDPKKPPDDTDPASNPTLGQLLKHKAAPKAVRVCLAGVGRSHLPQTWRSPGPWRRHGHL
eukprot:jgi/Botrbrau1/1352/Bobra.0063s0063.1